MRFRKDHRAEEVRKTNEATARKTQAAAKEFKPCPSPNCRGGMRTSGEVCATCWGAGEVQK